MLLNYFLGVAELMICLTTVYLYLILFHSQCVRENIIPFWYLWFNIFSASRASSLRINDLMYYWTEAMVFWTLWDFITLKNRMPSFY